MQLTLRYSRSRIGRLVFAFKEERLWLENL